MAGRQPAESKDSTSLVDRVERIRFLGREFLTWLWFESETHDGKVQAGDLGEVSVEFQKRLSLDSAGNVPEVNLVRAEDPTATEESRVALKMGKKVGETRIVLHAADHDFQLALAGETLQIKGVKLPTALATEDGDKLAERLDLLDEVEGLVDTIYARFVRMRMNEQTWAPVRRELRAWVERGGDRD